MTRPAFSNPHFAAQQKTLASRILARQGRRPWIADYAAYRNTAHWQEVRARTLARFGNRCAVCNEFRQEQLQCHHRDYSRLGHELAADVVLLCDTCHTLFSHAGRLAKPEVIL